jgi:FAD synthetase
MSSSPLPSSPDLSSHLKIDEMINSEKGSLVEFHAALELYDKLYNCNDKYISASLKSALSILGDTFRLYGNKNVFSSYNGGKDAEVVMHLIRASAAKFSLDSGVLYRPNFIYFTADGEFPEVTEQIDFAERTYDMKLVRYSQGITEGLKSHIDKFGGDACQAIVLGTRKGDPNSPGQETFSPSSSWMPPFMRVNPILDWHYGHIWYFLRSFETPYCPLYDRGYTSLGTVSNTQPNPALLDVATGMYRPAHELFDWSLERAGRQSRKRNVSDTKVGTVATRTRASLLIIGDEILRGSVQECNLRAAAIELDKVGTRVDRVVVCRDDVEEISKEVTELSQTHDLVITSGGVGPTHDDVTLKGVALSLNR